MGKVKFQNLDREIELKPKKISIGVRSAKPIFGLSSISGTLIDDLLSHSEKNKSLKNLFTQVEQDAGKSQFKLIGDCTSLFVGIQDIVYTTDHYESGKSIIIDEEIEKFSSLISCIAPALKSSGTRRIGIVCEYRTKSKTEQPSRELIEKLTKMSCSGFPAKFQIQFENRQPINTNTGIPDVRTDDFWNIIESLYDSENDTDHSLTKHINVMIDVQRYYKPLLKDKFENALKVVTNKFNLESKIILEKPYIKELMNGD